MKEEGTAKQMSIKKKKEKDPLISSRLKSLQSLLYAPVQKKLLGQNSNA